MVGVVVVSVCLFVSMLMITDLRSLMFMSFSVSKMLTARFGSFRLLTVTCYLFVIPAECQSAHFEASPWSTRISNSLGLSVAYTPVALLREHKFEGPPYGDARASLNVPRWIGDLMGHCSPLLKCSAHGLQFAAYYLLAK